MHAYLAVGFGVHFNTDDMYEEMVERLGVILFQVTAIH